MFKLIAFDMDGTLAPSKGQMDPEMTDLFKKLLTKYKVAIISGGDYVQFEKQVISFLGDDENILKNLFILPTCGTKLYKFENKNWQKIYSLDFTLEERQYIVKVLEDAIIDLDLKPETIWGKQVEDRGTQITFSALGQEAPLEVKHTWDRDQEKRKRIRNYILKDLQNFNILIGGSSSIDITKSGVDKAYGMKKLNEILDISLDEMIFVGDAIFPGGNDYPPLTIGVTSKKVETIEDTKKYIKTLITN
ncbi:HAD-IIB family hydrolase [Candidatus Gracilibacteria bacterium]|nr:HAD-IIB family hydrolase [Candidatus Gracilibacteria bacterium]